MVFASWNSYREKLRCLLWRGLGLPFDSLNGQPLCKPGIGTNAIGRHLVSNAFSIYRNFTQFCLRLRYLSGCSSITLSKHFGVSILGSVWNEQSLHRGDFHLESRRDLAVRNALTRKAFSDSTRETHCRRPRFDVRVCSHPTRKFITSREATSLSIFLKTK